ncbi:MAG TPA: glycosyltransferase [Candidatus Saccharimonadales bacterium]|nr:glycosyltransferase [Candidatus Saccharimonadales bacterium]
MTPNPILFDIFIAIGLIYLLHFGLYLVGANFYDIWQFNRQKKLPKRHHGKRPLVTVLIAAYNEELSIIRCLESIRKNTYRKWQIVVVDDGSKDKTHELVMQYICDHPNRSISLLKMPKNSGKAAALNYGLKRQAQGDLIMTLDADSILHNKAITNAVTYFGDEKVAGVAANVRVMDTPTIIGLLQRFEHMIGYRSKKFYSLTNSEFIIGGVASTYRRSIMKEVGFYDTDTQTEDIGLSLKIASQGNVNHRLVYGVDVVAMTEGVKDFKTLLRQRYRWKMGMIQNLLKNKALFGNNNPEYSWSLTMYRIPMAFLGEVLLVLEPLAWAYLIYLSIAFHTLSIFVGAYMTITLYIFWNIWPDEHASFRRKLSMSVYAPILYFIFYIMSVVQIVSIFRCLFNLKQITRKVETDGKWVSPERSGQTAANIT